MKHSLYLELATRDQSRNGLGHLLRFPDERWFSDGTWRVQCWKNGKSSSKRGKSREEGLHHAGDAVNELRMTFSSNENVTKRGLVEVAEIWFHPAPTSELWQPVDTNLPLGPRKNRERRNFKNKETLIGNKDYLHPYFSVLECSLIDFEGADAVDSNEMIAEWIIRVMPAQLMDLELVGYGCLGGNCRRQMMLHNLGGVPAAVDQLGEKFEEIYPILIGPRKTCEGLVTSLSGIAKLHLVSTKSPTAIVTIPVNQINGSTRDLAHNWIIDLPALAEDYRQSILRIRSKS